MQKPLWLMTLFITVSGLLIFGSLLVWQKEQNKSFQVIFLDIGQGDAILIQDGNNQVLIDGGRNGKDLLERLGHYIPFWDHRIEVMIATHPDSDHIGGLGAVLKNYKVEVVLTNGQVGETETARLFEKLASERAKEKRVVANGGEILLPSGSKIKFLYPLSPLSEESVINTNEGSLVARLEYENFSFLFTGDLAREEQALEKPLPVDVLKVAHHGSKFSTSDAFLDIIHPKEAVISVGAENTYGHPHQEVLRNLQERGIIYSRTDEEGDIVYKCSKKINTCERKSKNY